MNKIVTDDDLINAVNFYGILPFWSETEFSAWTLCDTSQINFMHLWYKRERVVNSGKVAYGKFVNKKATFVSLTALPYLAALRRDGYDFDSLADEGKAPRREIEIMNAIGTEPTPSYNLGKTLNMKGYDTVVTSLQNKTYLCVTFKKSAMGTALLSRPEDLFGHDFVRSAYCLSADENIQKLTELCPGLKKFDEQTRKKILTTAV